MNLARSVLKEALQRRDDNVGIDVFPLYSRKLLVAVYKEDVTVKSVLSHHTGPKGQDMWTTTKVRGATKVALG